MVEPPRRDYQREYYLQNVERYRELALLRNHGLTKEQYDAMVKAQDGRCKVCKEPLGSYPVVDHDHRTGSVRGILHSGCNTLVGYLEHRLRPQAEKYMEES